MDERMKKFIVSDPLFKTEVLFVMNCTHGEMCGYIWKQYRAKVEPSDDCIGMMLTFIKAPWRVVWVESARRKDVLVHELFHLVTRVCQDKQVPVVAHHEDGANGDETAAYLIELYYRECTKAMKKVKG